MKFMRSTFGAMVLVVFLAAHAFPSAAENRGANTLIRLEADFMKAAAERGSQGYMSYYAEDAAELPNGADMFRGKESIAKTMGFLDDKNNHLSWTPVYADMAASGDLAAYHHHGFWQPMDTLRDKTHLEGLWASGAAPWQVW